MAISVPISRPRLKVDVCFAPVKNSVLFITWNLLKRD